MDEKALRTKIQELIDKFERVKAQGKYKSYNEENTKKDFILPLFRALGWNVDDSEEVKAEEKVSKKRVDYAFRISGVIKFYLEAKPIREYLTEPKYAKQAIEYAWNKSVTWAILCNFEGIRVFNAEWKWDEKRPMRNSFLDLRYTDFLDSSFKYLTWLSRESFEQGILDKNAAILGKKTKKLPIDKQLLDDFTGYRNILTKDILKNNQSTNLSQDDLDELVQRILDRLIFIRTCEDKEIESEKLESLVRMYESSEGKLYKELNKKFREYDAGYNSKLFREHLCEDVIISNDTLKQVILGTYQTKDLSITYDFSAIGADVLGNIYEQYLGHILKKTSQRAKLTNGKAHRKEQGIYYTPTYIVDYIIRNTVGEKLKQRKVKVDELKILDPACGSGSFLLKAFDVICEHEIKKEGKTLQTKFEDVSGGKLLKRKTELLKNCIFGVDLDPQAVEIAQLNLLLKLAEKRHRLPTLQDNIKCGNSLIDDSAIAGNKFFKWEEQFKQIVDEGGFDIIIGNPPYIRNTELFECDKEFFIKEYSSAYKQFDIYVLFFEVGLKLLKNKGYLGFITSNKFIASDYGQKLRELFLERCRVVSLIDVSNLRIFKDASTYPVITVLQKIKDEHLRENNDILFQKIEDLNDLYSSKNIATIKQSKFMKDEDNQLLEYKGNIKFEIIKKIEKECIKIKDLFLCQRGSPKNKIKIVDNKIGNSLSCIISRDANRYYPKVSENIFVISDLQNKIIPKEKILMPRTVLSLKAAYEVGNNFIMDRIYYLIPKDGITINLKFVTGILNSKLMDFYYKISFSTTHVGGGYLDLRGVQIVELPIKQIPESQKQSLIKLVDKMLSLNKRLNEIGDKKTDERVRIEDEIKKTDEGIDNLVYTLYNMNKNEIEIINERIGV